MIPQQTSTFAVRAVVQRCAIEVSIEDYGYPSGRCWHIIGTTIWVAENGQGEHRGYDGVDAEWRALEWATSGLATESDLQQLRAQREGADPCPF